MNKNEVIDGAFEVRDLIFKLESDQTTDDAFRITEDKLLDRIDAVIDFLEEY